MESQKELVEIVKRWVIIDNQIRALNKKLKELRNEKKKQNKEMVEVMKQNDIDTFDIKDGQIQYKKETKREPLTQKTLINILSKHPLLGTDQAKNLNQFIYDNRKVTEKESIVRKINENIDKL